MEGQPQRLPLEARFTDELGDDCVSGISKTNSKKMVAHGWVGYSSCRCSVCRWSGSRASYKGLVVDDSTEYSAEARVAVILSTHATSAKTKKGFPVGKEEEGAIAA